MKTQKAQSEKVDSSKFGFKLSDWPLGSKVSYTGTRVKDHTGMTGTIVGYRPTYGLWVQFTNGKGSISVKQAKLVSKPASKSASRKAAPASAQAGEPAAETAESA